MQAYRLYFVGKDGRFEGVQGLDVADDKTAIAGAVHHADGRPMELWERERRVKAFGAASKSAERPLRTPNPGRPS